MGETTVGYFFIVDEDNTFRFLLQGKCIFVVNQFKIYY